MTLQLRIGRAAVQQKRLILLRADRDRAKHLVFLRVGELLRSCFVPKATIEQTIARVFCQTAADLPRQCPNGSGFTTARTIAELLQTSAELLRTHTVPIWNGPRARLPDYVSMYLCILSMYRCTDVSMYLCIYVSYLCIYVCVRTRIHIYI